MLSCPSVVFAFVIDFDSMALTANNAHDTDTRPRQTCSDVDIYLKNDNMAQTVTQYDMFGEPEVRRVRKPRRKMSDNEKAERKAERDLQKKIAQEKAFEDYWSNHGYKQGYMFGETVKNAVDESIQHFLAESGIEINPENKGKFTDTKERTGKSTSELLHSKNKKTRARANFARMAKRGFKPLKKE